MSESYDSAGEAPARPDHLRSWAQTPRNERPKGTKQAKSKLGNLRMKRLSAQAVIERCLARGVFTARDIFDSTPAIRDAYDSANALGTSLGQGVAGRGMKLWDSPRGSHVYVPVRQNARIACVEARDQLAAIAAALGFPTVEEMLEAVEKLPSLEEWETMTPPPAGRLPGLPGNKMVLPF